MPTTRKEEPLARRLNFASPERARSSDYAESSVSMFAPRTSSRRSTEIPIGKARDRRKQGSPSLTRTVPSHTSPPRHSKDLPSVPISMARPASAASRRGPRATEDDFEDMLSSGHTLVISPGPRESFLPSDSDTHSDGSDHLEMGSDIIANELVQTESASHSAIMAEALNRTRRVSGSRSRTASPVLPRSSSSQTQNGMRGNGGLKKNTSTGSHRDPMGKMQRPVSADRTPLQLLSPSPTKSARSSPRHGSNDNSVDTVMPQATTPTGSRRSSQRSNKQLRSPVRSPVPSRPVSATGSPRLRRSQTSPKSNDGSSANGPAEPLPVHPHERESYRSPKQTSAALKAETSSNDDAHINKADTAERVSTSIRDRDASSSPPLQRVEIAAANVPLVTIESDDVEPGQVTNAVPPTTRAEQPIMAPRTKQLMSNDASYDSSSSSSRNADGNASARKEAGQERGLRTRFKKTSSFFKRLGSSTAAVRTNAPDSESTATDYAKDAVAGPSSTQISALPVGRVRTPNASAASMAKDDSKDSSNHLVQKTEDGASSAGPVEASESNATVNSLSSSHTSASIGYRQKMREWKRDLDDALQQSGNDLEAKTKIEAPKKYWGPGPQLPEYKLNRKGSFMDDRSVGTNIFDVQDAIATDSRTAKRDAHSALDDGAQISRSFTATPTGAKMQAQRTPSTVTTISRPNASYDTSDRPRERIASPSLGRAKSPSVLTARSYETASAATQMNDDSDAEGDPEQSIRLIGGRRSSGADKAESRSVARESDGKGRIYSPPTPAKDLPVPNLKDQSLLSTHDKHTEGAKEKVWDTAGAVLGEELATKCWNEDETFKKREKIAEWLGSGGQLNSAARQAYFAKFDFKDLGVEAALRKLCDKLYLKAETQQIDRILSVFSERYYRCNPQSLFGSVDVIHAVSFSILLLNTDLHIADIEQRMTRQQFVRNTLDAIFESEDIPDSLLDVAASDKARQSVERTTTRDGNDEQSPRSVSERAENALKDIYTAVKADRIRLPLPLSSTVSPPSSRRGRLMGGDRVNALKRGSIRGVQGLMGAKGPAAWEEEEGTFNSSRTDSPSGTRSSSDSHRGAGMFGVLGSHGYNQTPSKSAIGFTGTLTQSKKKESEQDIDCASMNSTADDLNDDELALCGPPWAKEGILTHKHYYEAPQKRARDKAWIECFVVVQKGLLSMFKFGENKASSNALKQQSNAIGGGNWATNATCIGQISLAHSLANVLPPPGYNRSRPHVFALTLPSGSVHLFQTGHEELAIEWVSTSNYWAARLSREPLAAGVSNMEYGWNRVMPRLGTSEGINNSMELGDDGEEPTSDYMTSPPKNSSDSRSIRSSKSVRSGRLRSATGNLLSSRRTSDRSSFDRVVSPGGSMNSDITSPAASLGSHARTTPGSTSFRIDAIDRPHFVNEWRAPAAPTTNSTLNEDEQLEACTRYMTRVKTELSEHNSLRQPMIDLFKNPGTSNMEDGAGTMSGLMSPKSSTLSLPPTASSASVRMRSPLSNGSSPALQGTLNRRGRSNTNSNTALAAKALVNWERKSSYLLAELTKLQVYVESLHTAIRLRGEKRDERELNRMMRKADEDLSAMEV